MNNIWSTWPDLLRGSRSPSLYKTSLPFCGCSFDRNVSGFRFSNPCGIEVCADREMTERVCNTLYEVKYQRRDLNGLSIDDVF